MKKWNYGVVVLALVMTFFNVTMLSKHAFAGDKNESLYSCGAIGQEYCSYEAWRWCDEVLCDIHGGCMDIWFDTCVCIDPPGTDSAYYYRVYCFDDGVWNWYICYYFSDWDCLGKE